MTPHSSRLFTTALMCSLAAPLAAEQLISDGLDISDTSDLSADLFVADVSVLDGKVCMGNSCMETETFDIDTALKINSSLPSIEFIDSTPDNPSGYGTRDWRLHINGNGPNAPERMAFEDRTAQTFPFTVMGATPSNALFVASTGFVGLGTSLPSAEIHIVDGLTPAIRLEQDTTGGQSAQLWDMTIDDGGWQLINHNGGTLYPFRVENTNSSDTLVLADGHVGIGTQTPLAGLHVQRENAGHVALLVEDETSGAFTGIAPSAFVHVRSSDGAAAMKIEEVNATAKPRALLNLQNNGRPEIAMGNTAKGREWLFSAGASFFLKTGALGNAKTKVFTVKSNGDAVLAGTLTTGGTTCGGGCDAVFSDDYDLPSIADHARAMYALGHLPNMGPMPEGTAFNLTDKFGRLLNEVEHAHIYIDQLHDRLDAQQQLNSALLNRLAVLEAKLAD